MPGGESFCLLLSWRFVCRFERRVDQTVGAQLTSQQLLRRHLLDFRCSPTYTIPACVGMILIKPNHLGGYSSKLRRPSSGAFHKAPFKLPPPVRSTSPGVLAFSKRRNGNAFERRKPALACLPANRNSPTLLRLPPSCSTRPSCRCRQSTSATTSAAEQVVLSVSFSAERLLQRPTYREFESFWRKRWLAAWE